MNPELRIITDPIFAEHLTGPGHPEQPMRYFAMTQALKNNGLLTKAPLPPRMATDEEIRLCHSKQYLELVKDEVADIAKKNLDDDGTIWLSTGDVSICSKSLIVARLAVGAMLEAVDLVMQNSVKRVFVAVRPPGHHASSNAGKGFCLFNNAAIGARYAQKNYGIKKILIADWDVHHGDGTQAIFEDDPSIFYFSTHRYGYGFYPGTGSAREKGRGNILNCPINAERSPRIEVIKAFRENLSKAMETFSPELVIISAGFDAHEKDPLGGFDLKDEDFAELTHIIRGIADRYCKGRLVSVLEGGYSLEGLASSVCSHVKALI